MDMTNLAAPVFAKKMHLAFTRGQRAKAIKMGRVSTEYDDDNADEYFFAGYDGLSWEQTIKKLHYERQKPCD
jgi:hypothetical protein